MVQHGSHALWAIVLSFFIAYLLALVPIPEWAMDYRPQWVYLVLMYWIMALPYRVGLGSAWLAGLVLDLLQSSVLGLNALVMVTIAYVVIRLHLRLRMSSIVQQSGTVLILIGLSLLLRNWLEILIVSDRAGASGWMFLMAAVTSGLTWPLLFIFMRGLRRRV
ncbi:MAG: rod shape-determining protein MreD [Pseudohongiellaceae bacterium]